MRRVVALAALLVACSPTKSVTMTTTNSSSRPDTPATLQILQPTPNQVVVGSTVHLVLQLTGAIVVQPAAGPINPAQGHIHVSLDGKLVSMAYGTTQDITAVAPGPHAIQAAFVATDHLPFANTVQATVLFTVQA